MKSLSRLPHLSAILLLTAILSLFAGCATQAYKTESAADITISAAMTGWGDYVSANHPPVAEEIKVRAAFQKYQAAEILAIDATKGVFDLQSTNAAAVAGTNDVATAQLVAKARVQSATTAAASALADLVQLITSFGVKLTN